MVVAVVVAVVVVMMVGVGLDVTGTSRSKELGRARLGDDVAVEVVDERRTAWPSDRSSMLCTNCTAEINCVQ